MLENEILGEGDCHTCVVVVATKLPNSRKRRQ